MMFHPRIEGFKARLRKKAGNNKADAEDWIEAETPSLSRLISEVL